MRFQLLDHLFAGSGGRYQPRNGFHQIGQRGGRFGKGQLVHLDHALQLALAIDGVKLTREAWLKLADAHQHFVSRERGR